MVCFSRACFPEGPVGGGVKDRLVRGAGSVQCPWGAEKQSAPNSGEERSKAAF